MKIKKYFLDLKNALAYDDDGEVVVKSEVEGLAPGFNWAQR